MKVRNFSSEDELKMNIAPGGWKQLKGRDGKAEKSAYKSQGFERQ
jgi:hypothetical protein